MAHSPELPLPRLLAYALPALPLAVLTLPLYVVVPDFYTGTLGLPIAAVGQVLLFVRLFDAVSDPVVGVLADRWRGPWGRRRTWFAAGVPGTAVAAFALFWPPEGAGILHLALWSTALSLAWTVALVPYNAWGVELSGSYAGRARVAAVRESAVLVGTLVALALQAALPALGFAGTREIMAGYALLVALGLPAAALAALTAAPEPADHSRQGLPCRAGLAHLRANRPFLRLILAFLVNGFANGLPATLFLFFVRDRLALPDLAPVLLLAYFVCGLAGVPLWLWVARRSSKHRAWCMAMLTACAVFALVPLLPPGSGAAFLAVCVVTGLAVGADLVLPAAIQADVIDEDTAASGAQRSGLYLALWGLATKLALALAVGFAFPVLAAAGYDPGAGVREPSGLFALALLYAGLPVVLKLAAVALMWRFPLDAARQAQLRAAIEGR